MEKLANIEDAKRSTETKEAYDKMLVGDTEGAEVKIDLIRNPERHHFFEDYKPVSIRACLKYFGDAWDKSFNMCMQEAKESKSVT